MQIRGPNPSLITTIMSAHQPAQQTYFILKREAGQITKTHRYSYWSHSWKLWGDLIREMNQYPTLLKPQKLHPHSTISKHQWQKFIASKLILTAIKRKKKRIYVYWFWNRKLWKLLRLGMSSLPFPSILLEFLAADSTFHFHPPHQYSPISQLMLADTKATKPPSKLFWGCKLWPL